MVTTGKWLSAMIPLMALGSDTANNPPHQPGKTAIYYDPIYLQHDTGPDFPENPQRLRWMIDHLENAPVGRQIVWRQPDSDLDPLPWIRLVHCENYLRSLQKACERGARWMHDNPDCPLDRTSYSTALQAVVGALSAVRAVLSGELRNAFVALRPPGHHALPDQAKGFCLLNNIAIAARYAQKAHGIERILIVDWDLHHGDGTQTIFYRDPSVFYFSTHQYPYYPGPSGAPQHRGADGGEGFNLNIPLPAGSGDSAILPVYSNQLREVILQFQPQLVLISAGFDAHVDDPLGGLRWTSAVYGQLTTLLRQWTAELGHERVVSLLEGGYSRRALTEAVQHHLEALAVDLPPSLSPSHPEK